MNIRFENVWFAYETFGVFANPQHYQLQGISFEIRERECVGIVGRSGSGKTTLMQLCNGLLFPTRGRILVDGQYIHAPGYDLTALRRRLGVVFQFPEMQIFAATVEEEIAFGPRQQRLSEGEMTQRVSEALQQVGLDDSYAGRNPFFLSQGEKRRVALAGSLAMRPEMLILDEPTASLDARGNAEVRDLIRRWHTAGRTLVIISHDLDLIADLCPRMLIVEQGRLLYDGSTVSLWHSPLVEERPEILQRAGLPLPRSQRLRRHLARKGIPWESISVLKDGKA